MSRRVSPTAQAMLLCLICMLSLGCGITSKRTSLQDAVDELDAARVEPTDDDAETAPPRRPWRSPERVGDARRSQDRIALVSAEEPIAESQDPGSTTSPDGARDASVQPQDFAVGHPVEKISTDNFDAAVLASDKPVLVDFYADWCGPCKQLAPMLNDMAAETPAVKIVKVNIDESKKLARAYGIRSVPTLMVFKNGAPVSHHQGMANRTTIEGLLR
jgi:thioredoxin 1